MKIVAPSRFMDAFFFNGQPKLMTVTDLVNRLPHMSADEITEAIHEHIKKGLIDRSTPYKSDGHVTIYCVTEAGMNRRRLRAA